MARIYLKYLRMYPDTWVESNFDAVRVEPLQNTDRIQGRTLSGIEYNNVKTMRMTWKVTISADEIARDITLTTGGMSGGVQGSDNWNFIVGFYRAVGWKLSFDSTNWDDVVLKESGDMEPDYIDDHLGLPEITFTLINKNPG